MKPLPSFGLRFSRTQKAVLFFLSLLLCFQSVSYFFFKEKLNADALLENKALQEKWNASKADKKRVVYPFNPNYISAYKAYQLDLTAAQYKAIVAWRKEGNFFQTTKQFQAVTGVHDSWIAEYAAFFKWPIAPNTKGKNSNTILQYGELNTATVSDLKKVKGVGEILSQRILGYKKRLGGFAISDQLYEVYGLDSVVVHRIKAHFSLSAVSYPKIDFQTASLSELAALPYLSYKEAKQLIGLRTRNDTLRFQGLKTVLNWDALKFQRLALYLY